MQLFLWTAIYFVCVLCLSLLCKRIQKSKVFKIIFLPGFLLYSASRVIGCIASLSPVEKIEFVKNKKQFLTPGNTRILYFGHFLSVYATHISLVAIFFLLKDFIPVREWESFCFPVLDELWTEPGILKDFAAETFASIEFSNYLFWVTIYCFVSVAVSFDLSIKEFLATVCFNTGGCWACGMLTWLGVGVSFFSRGWFIKHFYISGWWGAGSFYILFMVLSLMGFLFLTGAVKTVKILFGEKRKKQIKNMNGKKRDILKV